MVLVKLVIHIIKPKLTTKESDIVPKLFAKEIRNSKQMDLVIHVPNIRELFPVN